MSTAVNKAFILLFAFSCNLAFGIDWPSGMYTSESVVKASLRDFKSYFGKLDSFYPVRWMGENTLFVYQGNELALSARLISMQRTNECSKNMVLIKSGQGISKRIIIENCAKPLKAFTLKDVLNLSFLKTLSNYKIHFVDWNYLISKKAVSGGFDTVFDRNDGGTRVVLIERISTESLYSEMYYNCNGCSMDPLVAIFERQGDVLLERYTVGESMRRISPLEFFAAANAFYLPWIFRKSKEFVGDAVQNASWPHVAD